jgi:hypothetical protein
MENALLDPHRNEIGLFRLNNELASLDKKPLHDRWDIIEHNNIKLTIYIDKKTEFLISLKIGVYKKNIYNIKSLPLELNNIICKFLTDYIIINAFITYPPEYPFVAPYWELIDTQHNIHSPPTEIPLYYSDIIKEHNNAFKSYYWIPAMTVESDILNFIQKINHFEYLFE